MILDLGHQFVILFLLCPSLLVPQAPRAGNFPCRKRHHRKAACRIKLKRCYPSSSVNRASGGAMPNETGTFRGVGNRNHENTGWAAIFRAGAYRYLALGERVSRCLPRRREIQAWRLGTALRDAARRR
jgi:hypothetical protein